MSGDSYRAENIIFTDLRFPEKAEGCEDDPLYQYATFWVEDVNEYETVRERIKSVDIEWEKYDFLDNTGKVENGYPKPSFFVKIWMKNIECVMLEHIC